jgi:hypothetical protein
VKIDTTTTIDDAPGNGTYSCGNAGQGCIKMHNGAIVAWNINQDLTGTSPLHTLFLGVDPDGVASSYEGVNFFLYINGKLRTQGTIEPNTIRDGDTLDPDPSMDPPWFSWN